MIQTIKTIDQLAKALETKIKSTLELVAEDVKKEIDNALDEYYDEYNPDPGDIYARGLKQFWYHRTEQLRNCCTIGKTRVDNNKINIEVYLDIDSLKYNTPSADKYKTVVAANAGLHGGWDTSNLKKGQVSWTAIRGNTGKNFGSGTQIWEEPMRKLIDNGKLVAIFKKHAKQRGLNIK